jgi:small ligand-binding sensory domain FIST
MAPAFLVGHATHPDWRAALALAAAQVEGGIAASGVEYIDEPALALMLAPLAPSRFEVFSGARRLSRIEPHTALVHADPGTPEIAELIAEMSDRTAAGYVFGGLSSARTRQVQIADGVWQGGLSGVAFTREVPIVSRVTQGCQPVGPVRRITACEGHVALELDGEPALPALLADLQIPGLAQARAALARLRGTFVGITDPGVSPLARGGQFGVDTQVRHLIGLEPARQGVAVAEPLRVGQSIAFCQRDLVAARRDLVRICSELRDEVESLPAPAWQGGDEAAPGPEGRSRIQGAIYVSCAGRGGPHFGGPSAELQIVRRALGDVPLVGFFAGGEIAHHHLYGYTGVLTVFTDHGTFASKQR